MRTELWFGKIRSTVEKDTILMTAGMCQHYLPNYTDKPL